MNWLTSFFRSRGAATPPDKPWTRPSRRPLRPDFHDAVSVDIDGKKVAIAKFRGIAANTHEDGHVFSAIEDAALKLLDAEQPDGLILDFSELAYAWGDEMGRTLGEAGSWRGDSFPVVVITSELNRRGLTSLVRDEMLAEPVDWLAESDAEARALMASKLKKMPNHSAHPTLAKGQR